MNPHEGIDKTMESQFNYEQKIKTYPAAKELPKDSVFQFHQSHLQENISENAMELAEVHSNKDEVEIQRPSHESTFQRRKRQEEDFRVANKKHTAKISRLSEGKFQFSLNTENKFLPLTTITDTQTTYNTSLSVANSSTNVTTESITRPITSPAPKPVKPKKPKPIILVTKVKYFRLRETFLQMTSELPVCQLCPKGLKIQANTEEDAQKIIRYFQDQKMEFYTFKSGEHKIIKLVMRGLPVDTPSTDIERQLKELRYPIESIRQLRKRVTDSQTASKEWIDLPLWVVSI